MAKVPDLISYSSVIRAHMEDGDVAVAVEYFKMAERMGITPKKDTSVNHMRKHEKACLVMYFEAAGAVNSFEMAKQKGTLDCASYSSCDGGSHQGRLQESLRCCTSR